MLLCDSQALRRPHYYKTSPLQASLLDLTITALNTAVETAALTMNSFATVSPTTFADYNSALNYKTTHTPHSGLLLQQLSLPFC